MGCSQARLLRAPPRTGLFPGRSSLSLSLRAACWLAASICQEHTVSRTIKFGYPRGLVRVIQLTDRTNIPGHAAHKRPLLTGSEPPELGGFLLVRFQASIKNGPIPTAYDVIRWQITDLHRCPCDGYRLRGRYHLFHLGRRRIAGGRPILADLAPEGPNTNG